MTLHVVLAATLAAASMQSGVATADDSVAAPPSVCAAAAAPFWRVRATDPELASALAEGVRRSATIAALVERIEASNGLVFLFRGPVYRFDGRTSVRGAMSHAVTVAPPFRVIRIKVDTRLGDRTIAVIAHELRHAVEVLDAPEARDRWSVEALYERIGYRVEKGLYETSAAHDAERDALRELSRCKPL